MRARRHSGFSLIEMVIAMAIVAVAAALAAPEFNRLLSNRRVSSAADDLYGTLFYARSEAIRRNQTVVVQAIDGDWSNGWEVPDPITPANLLLQHAQTKLTAAETSVGADSINYQPSGRLPSGAAPSFTLCDTTHRARQRVVTIDLSGLPNISLAGDCP
jgi:type IV fimbrial biogenesis protein FimT